MRASRIGQEKENQQALEERFHRSKQSCYNADALKKHKPKMIHFTFSYLSGSHHVVRQDTLLCGCYARKCIGEAYRQVFAKY